VVFQRLTPKVKIYFGMYALYFIVIASSLFSKGFSWNDFAGVVVLGGVLVYMYSIIKKSQKIVQEYEIEIQKEAILRASKELQK
jgi:Ca2+/Na+ antiporter